MDEAYLEKDQTVLLQGIKVIFRNVKKNKNENYTYWKLKMENGYTFSMTSLTNQYSALIRPHS